MNINEKIKEVKERISLLTKDFTYSSHELDLLTVAYLSISSIDNEITDLIDEVLSSCFVLFRFKNKKLTKILKENNLDKNSAYHLEIKNIEKNEKYKLIVIEEHNNVTDTLKSLIHELKHAINNVIDKYNFDGKMATLYLGLAELKYGTNKYNQLQRKQDKVLLEETFNSFMTKIYMEVIEYLKNADIQDEGIKDIIESIDLNGYYYTYTSLTKSMENLYTNEEMFKLFYNATLYKDFIPLKKKLHELYEIDFEEDNEIDILDLIESELRLIKSQPALKNVIAIETIKDNIDGKKLSFIIRFENI